MIKILAGKMGSGKTKRMIQLANDAVTTAKGNVFFIDDDNRNIYELDSKIRFINLEDFAIDNTELLYGFICGLINCDYDMEHLYIDGLDYLSSLENELLDKFIHRLELLGKDNNVEIILCFNRKDGEITESVKRLLI